jgi:hypothetical protein
MLVVRLEGGLANRMFQYALFIHLKKKRKDVFVDESSFQPSWSFEKISLKDTFPQINCPEIDLSKFWLETKQNKIVKLLRNIAESFGGKYFYQKDFIFYDQLLEDQPLERYYRGYWQSEKYFSDVFDEVKAAFTFDNFDEQRNIDVADNMQNENSIAIHVRKGKDYSRNGGITYGTCPKEYYTKAIDYMMQKVANPVFYVFTDNPKWVKDNITGIKYQLVDWNPVSGKKNYRDIQLMSCCKHNIIANSSFSWWGAWLNGNPDKIVIGPKQWFNPLSKISKFGDIICDSWIAL